MELRGFNKKSEKREFSRSELDRVLIELGHNPKDFVFAHELSID